MEGSSEEIARLSLQDLGNYLSNRKEEHLIPKAGYANTQFFLLYLSLCSPPAPPLPPHQQTGLPVSGCEGNSKGLSEMFMVAEGSQPGIKDLLEIVSWKINTFD